MLKIYGVILEVVKELGPVIGQIERRDPDLARQMRRAASSVAIEKSLFGKIDHVLGTLFKLSV